MRDEDFKKRVEEIKRQSRFSGTFEPMQVLHDAVLLVAELLHGKQPRIEIKTESTPGVEPPFRPGDTVRWKHDADASYLVKEVLLDGRVRSYPIRSNGTRSDEPVLLDPGCIELVDRPFPVFEIGAPVHHRQDSPNATPMKVIGTKLDAATGLHVHTETTNTTSPMRAWWYASELRKAEAPSTCGLYPLLLTGTWVWNRDFCEEAQVTACFSGGLHYSTKRADGFFRSYVPPGSIAALPEGLRIGGKAEFISDDGWFGPMTITGWTVDAAGQLVANIKDAIAMPVLASGLRAPKPKPQKPPVFHVGQRVYVIPLGREATVKLVRFTTDGGPYYDCQLSPGEVTSRCAEELLAVPDGFSVGDKVRPRYGTGVVFGVIQRWERSAAGSTVARVRWDTELCEGFWAGLVPVSELVKVKVPPFWVGDQVLALATTGTPQRPMTVIRIVDDANRPGEQAAKCERADKSWAVYRFNEIIKVVDAPLRVGMLVRRKNGGYPPMRVTGMSGIAGGKLRIECDWIEDRGHQFNPFRRETFDADLLEEVPPAEPASPHAWTPVVGDIVQSVMGGPKMMVRGVGHPYDDGLEVRCVWFEERNGHDPERITTLPVTLLRKVA